MKDEALFPRVPLAVPYWSGESYRAIARAIVTGGILHGAAIEKLRLQISQRLKIEDVLLCGSGSLALELALRTCAVEPGDEVILPAFCCSAVVPPILAVGATPVLADVGEELNLTAATVDAAITQKSKAVIVPHLFGNPAEIGAIAELARSKNICVVDDTAQALGATIDGRPMGGFGDAGILSFGHGKICSGIGGGVLLLPDLDALADGPTTLARPTRRSVARKLGGTLIHGKWRRWTRPLWQAVTGDEPVSPGALPAAYDYSSMANLQATVAASLFESLEENIAARRARMNAYQQLLGGDERLRLVAHRTGSACLAQAVRVLPWRRCEDGAAQLVAALVDGGYEIQGSYVPIHLLGAFKQCVWDRLPHTERVWNDLIELPCEPSVTFDEITRIAELITRAVGKR